MIKNCGHCGGSHDTIDDAREYSELDLAKPSTERFVPSRSRSKRGPDRDRVKNGGFKCGSCGDHHPTINDVKACSEKNPGTFHSKRYQKFNLVKGLAVGEKILINGKKRTITGHTTKEMDTKTVKGLTYKVGKNHIFVSYMNVAEENAIAAASSSAA